MSADGRFTFLCPACQVRLTTPCHFAGKIGPCPSCQTLIEAPQNNPTTLPEELPDPETPSQAEELAPPALPTWQPSVHHTEPIEVPSAEELPHPADPPRRHSGSLIMRSLVPVSLLSMVVVVGYTVKIYISEDPCPPVEGITHTVEVREEPERVESILPAGEEVLEIPPVEAEEPIVVVPDPPVLEFTEPEADTPLTPPPAPSGDLRAVDGGIKALALLEDFLAMKTLRERLPHIETQRPETDLAGSVLDGPLPGIIKISVDVRETYASEQIVDHYYLVDFPDTAGGVNPQTLLVRSRGSGAPKVVADPFLDLFGGRFARYAEKATEEAATFNVIISAGAYCNDDVPAPDEKFTLKILSREDTREIAKAYFGKSSKIGAMLEDEASGLAYGQAKPCTVLMRWNREEDPEKPFLEALEIKALNWNP